MSKFFTSLLFTGTELLRDQIIETDINGKILTIRPFIKGNNEELEFLQGALVPGFINAHCHLELSHLKSRIPTGTGLIQFIKNILKLRDDTPHQIQTAMQDAQNEMFQAGIIAVGDISNRVDSFSIKNQGILRYHSFIEAFDLLQDHQAEQEYAKSKAVFDYLEPIGEHTKSIVPHAPYTVSTSLAKLLFPSIQDPAPISIHHQEFLDENSLFSTKTGSIVGLLNSIQLSVPDYIITGSSAAHRVIQTMSAKHRTLLVHNTVSTREDIQAIQDWNSQVFWVTCPNANLYIENKLPCYSFFLENQAKICIGTDSLASNWQLSILEEIKTILKYQSSIPFIELIRWATLNGAQALGFDHDLGSIEPGKTPGLVNLFPFDMVNLKPAEDTLARRII